MSRKRICIDGISKPVGLVNGMGRRGRQDVIEVDVALTGKPDIISAIAGLGG